MAENWVDTVADDLRRWAGPRAATAAPQSPQSGYSGRGAEGPGDDGVVDVEGIILLLDLAREELDLPGPAALTPDLLRELLLEVFPETVVAGSEEVPGIVGAARDLFAFLRESGTVTDAAATALEERLDGLTPEFGEVVASVDGTERRAAAEVISGMMLAEGVPVDDEEAVQRWMKEFEALPEEERYARTEEFLREIEERVVPPVRLASEAELAAAARASELTAQIRALAVWTGDGRPVNEFGELSAEDATAAAEALALATPRRSPDVLEQADLPELDRLWWAARDAEVIVEADGAARPGPARDLLDASGAASGAASRTASGADSDDGSQDASDDGSGSDSGDGSVLDVWVRLFDGVAVPEHDPEGGLDVVRLVQNELTGVLIHLYEQEAPTPPDELAEELVGHVMEAYEVSEAEELSGAVEAALALELDDLTRWGVLTTPDDQDPSGGGRALTPLGVWAVRELLLADGFAAPVVGDLADAPAAMLVAGLTWHRHDTADEEITGWLDGRDAGVAARDLLEVMRAGGPGARNLAAAVLQRVGPEAEAAVREATADRPVRPYALLWLDRLASEKGARFASEKGARKGTRFAAEEGDRLPSEEGEGALDRDDYLWLFIDTVAGMLETAEPREAVAAAVADAPDGADLSGMVEEMWRADHPSAADVLTALGAHHPDRTIAKAARTAAYKARSVRTPS